MLNTFASDYNIGACPEVFKSIGDMNFTKFDAYQTDSISEECKRLVLEKCKLDDAEIFAFSGGTQANSVLLDFITPSRKAIIATSFSHISVHEAGAVEALGHKIITIQSKDGKLDANDLEKKLSCVRNDVNFGHTSDVGSCFITQPTELGTLYSKKELKDIYDVCGKYRISLHVDGARLAYALGADDNDAELEHVAKFSDSFYIGGNKCGALFGELGVLKGKWTNSQKYDFLSRRKSMGALLAKSFLVTAQFLELLSNGLYEQIGKKGDYAAKKISKCLERNNVELYMPAMTNQIFLLPNDNILKRLGRAGYQVPDWDNIDGKMVKRMVFDWTWGEESIKGLIEAIENAR